MPNITTSIPLEWWNKARELNIKWNEAMIRGIKEICDEPFKESFGETIEVESWKSKAQNVQRTMQQAINVLQEEKDVLEKEKR